MRITNLMNIDLAVRHMEENQEKLAALRQKATTGKQFQYASENPSGASKVLELRGALTTSQAYLDSAHVADNWMAATEFSLGQMLDLSTRALTLSLEGLSDTNGNSERINALGTEIENLLKSAVDVGNHTHENKYVFSGFRITTQPFSLSGNTVTYNGGHNEQIKVDIGSAQTITTNLDGETLFMPFFQALGAAATALKTVPFDSNALGAAIDQLQSSIDAMKNARGSYGTRQRQVRTAIDYLDKTQYEMKKLISYKEDVNLAEAISYMQLQQTTYQTVLEVSQRAISAANLFDYLG
ncbi:MAG TPA: flagellin [Anaerolineaceae bacterium]